MSARNVRRDLIFLAAGLLFIAALVFGWRRIEHYRYERARTQWKNETLPRLAGMSIEDEQIRTELYQIKNPTPTVNVGWAHDHVLLMTNGECIIYAFRHGFNSGLVDHLFLAHGTDNKWYYSTYHFCSSMVMIRGDDAPGSIEEFAQRYSLREFDGNSDECLKHTWPRKTK